MTQAQSTSRLLLLPRELRDSIYSLAIVQENEHMPVTKRNFTEPPLLYVCKQIRKEASPIFYCENSFLVVVDRLDTTILLRWSAKVQRIEDLYNRTMNQNFVVTDEPWHRSWPDLMLWMRRYHAGDVLMPMMPYGYVMEEDYYREYAFITGMFEVVETLGETPWAVVEKVLEAQRHSLAGLACGWAPHHCHHHHDDEAEEGGDADQGGGSEENSDSESESDGVTDSANDDETDEGGLESGAISESDSGKED